MLDVVEKLLIVDNNGTAGTAICDVLVDAGYGCTTVSNALATIG